MRALTLHQPWAWAITDASKRIENRSWRPPGSLMGRMFCIHAGAKLDNESVRIIEQEFGLVVPPDLPRKAFVGAARLVDVVTESQDPWFAGPMWYGWVLADVIKFKYPIPCPGQQGLWYVPHDIRDDEIYCLYGI